MVKSFIDASQQNFFGKVRELENAFFDKAVTLTQTELEEFAAGKLDDVSEDVQVPLHSLGLHTSCRIASHLTTRTNDRVVSACLPASWFRPGLEGLCGLASERGQVLRLCPTDVLDR